jgi:hypothetical protein
MTSESTNSNAGTQRTRRNIMKMGGIAVPAVTGTVHSAAAGEVCLPWPLNDVCINLPIPTPPATATTAAEGIAS